ncbi:MAG: acetyl-CoA C-acetyltransferase [Chitinophagales bacterium]|nr:acetyl-CoA C-acetyltransferase [Chitinophagales bacterium]MCZ2392805.1 acetyl-CoA C-acetyltransferase [Chitinophagales bacterium]
MNYSNHTKKVAIVGYNRIPFARQNTAYSEVTIHEMMVAALNGLIDKCNLQGELLGEVAGGAVLKSSEEPNLMKDSIMKTSLHPNTPAVDLQQACDTGIEAAVYIANKIALGQIEVGIAGGADSTSQVPIVLSDELTRVLLEANRAKTNTERLKAIAKIRPKHFIPTIPANQEPLTGLSMGGHTEYTVKYYRIGRAEQDQLAFESHKKMAAAYEDGFFDDMITPFKGLTRDNNLRPDTKLEKLATLKPAFDKNGGTMTAGNSTPLSDGASVVLLASEEWAKSHNLPILAYISFAQLAAIEYVENKHNLLMAPAIAAHDMLKKANLKLQDFDFYEIHEAFAGQVLATLKIWESEELSAKLGIEALGSIDRNKLNVKGSSLAAAHPFAATGGRIIATLAKLLNEKGSGKGFISICAARGQGLTMILEK